MKCITNGEIHNHILFLMKKKIKIKTDIVDDDKVLDLGWLEHFKKVSFYFYLQ